MLFFRKREYDETKPLKQEIFEEALSRYAKIKIVCLVETAVMLGLIIAFIVKAV